MEKKPCDQCPWSRTTEPGFLGGSEPEVYLGQIVAGFWLPCHKSAHYEGKATDVNAVTECHGAAIFRGNIGVEPPRGLLALPPNKELVFGTMAQFYCHHKQPKMTPAQARRRVENGLRDWIQRELNDPNVRAQLKLRKEARQR